MAKRISKYVDGELRNKLLSVTEDDFTASYVYDLFGEYNEGKRLCNPYDLLEVPENSYGPEKRRNKNRFTTTVGLWLFNKWFIEKDLFDLFKYINTTMTNDQLGDMNSTLSYALMEDKIPLEAFKRYLMKVQFCMQFVSVLAPNYSEALLTITPKVNKLKQELITKYKKELDNGDTLIADQIEKQLINYALELLDGDPALDIFVSGARSSIPNHFKNLFVWKGTAKDPNPNAKNPYRIATSNYADGIKKEEYSLYCNAGIAGAYSRGRKTETGGYLENLTTMAYHDLILGEPGSDCKTKRYIEVDLTKKNVNQYIYNNIITSSGKLIELTSENMKDYIGKKVKMRMAYLCEAENPCNACAGNFYYRLGIQNVGLTLMQVFSIYKNKAMKAFHDSTVQLTEIDTMKAFGLK